MGESKRVVIHTDGACEGNPGPGGWAAVLRYGANCRELSGGELWTTNNRMELTAAIEALNALKRPCQVDLHTDSQYLLRGITEWLPAWKARGWRTRDHKPVQNQDLWQALDRAAARHQVSWRWIQGHAGHPDNERCDRLAREAIRQLRRNATPQQLEETRRRWDAGGDGGPDQPDLLDPLGPTGGSHATRAPD